jgi:hypothetical protein
MNEPLPFEYPLTFTLLPKALHPNVEPGTSPWSRIDVAVLLHIWNVVCVFDINGLGFIVNTTVCAIPGGQPFACGVTRYVTVSFVDPEFEIVCAIIFPPLFE